MSKILKIHFAEPDNEIKGIGQTNLVTLDSFKKTDDNGNVTHLEDQLATQSSLSRKPASSIPSIFARMIFFRMAFGGISKINIALGKVIPVYNSEISQCLDLLQMLYKNEPGISVEEFSFDQQLTALYAGGYEELHDALQMQQAKFMEYVDTIYLFKKDGKVIGGTSPYSLVFTSVNWSSGQPTKSLLEREISFREYVYKLKLAYDSAGFDDVRLKEFFDYVEACLKSDNDLSTIIKALRGVYTLANLQADYPSYAYTDAQMVQRNVQIIGGGVPLMLHSRNAANFDSDFFINATVNGNAFNAATTPLVLSNGSHNGMIYYDGKPWKAGTKVVAFEGEEDDIVARPLPDCGVMHTYLTPINFFEQKLIALPYTIDASRFAGSIKINDNYSALLPLKPMFFKYFKIADLQDKLIVRDTDTNIQLTLRIPVRNAGGTKNNVLELVQVYDKKTDICYLTNSALKTHLNVGISPFFKSGIAAYDKYYIMLSMENASKYSPELKLYNQGSSNELEIDEPIVRTKSPLTKYYAVDSFDYIRVVMTGNDEAHPAVNAIILPKFETVQYNGNEQYYYAVDFGTTNTHIAYAKSVGDAVSFGADDIKMQAVYLNQISTTKNGIDNLGVAKAREFFPQIMNGDSYTFPIRTVTGQNGILDGNAALFSNTSIGFHYSKEFTTNSMYRTNIKWKFLHSVDTEDKVRAQRFFREILFMIKNHWVRQTDSNAAGNRYPVIMLTFPFDNNLGMIESAWKDEYIEVFGVSNIIAGGNIRTMTESLAPCYSLINGGNATVNGILNVDIGGGTTDMQYYMTVGNVANYFYDSILFAGDDLWGKSYENMSEGYNLPSTGAEHFVKYADNVLAAAQIRVGNDVKAYNDISLEGKEKINCLLRDSNGHFVNKLASYADGNNRVCRAILFLHYSAIMYHLTNWLALQGASIPEVINFSGYGSKYIDLLFQNKDYLTYYSRALINKFMGGNAIFPENFRICFEQGNPKNVTAEGAALYARTGAALPVTTWKQHFGFDGAPANIPNADLLKYENNVKAYFDKFIDAFDTIFDSAEMANIPNAGNRVPRLTKAEVANLKSDAITAYKEISTKEMQSNPHGSLSGSMFVWALKKSINNIH